MQITVESAGGQRLVARIRGHEIVLDQPREGDGTDAGPTPTELFIASLAGCVAQYAELYLRRHHMENDGFRVNCRFEMNSGRPPRVAKVEIDVEVPHALDAQERGALQRVVDHCALTNTLVESPTVLVRITDAVEAATAPGSGG